MPEGGRIRIESGMTTRSLTEAAEPADFMAIRVIDDGSGMAEHVAARAVEPFYTTKERGKGTGLGLAQVYGFVRQCGGDLRIASAPGSGTTIEILLPHTEPVMVAEENADTMAPSLPSATRERATVLVIDDDDAVRAVIVDALEAAGFDVVQAADGKTGLALMAETQPAAAVIDFIMPA
jgi:signal transduction histidine kinase